MDPTVSTHKDTVKGADAELKKLRSKAKNGLHLASMVFCSSLQTRVLGILVDPVVQDFDKAITENKTPRSAQHRNVLTAEGEHIQLIMRSVCGQLFMGKPFEGMGFHTIAPGIFVACKSRKIDAWPSW